LVIAVMIVGAMVLTGSILSRKQAEQDDSLIDKK